MKSSNKNTSWFIKSVIKYLPLGFIIFVWFAFSSPYFLRHSVPFPTRQLVTFFAPWNQYDKYAGPVKNNAMPDVVTQIYPWKHFVVSELKEGRMPLWNPNNFSGNPALANFQTAVFSPFTLLYFILPFIDAWSLTVLLQPLLAGIFTYFLTREMRVSRGGAVVSALGFMFSGFIVVWMAYGTLSMAVAFLPLILLSLEKFLRKNKIRFLIPAALAVTVSLFSGHFQTSLYVLITSFVFIVYRYATDRRFKRMMIACFALLSGCVLALPQLIPTFVLYTQSFRSSNAIVDGGIPLYYLITSFAPDFFGSPVTRNDWVGFYAERASFIGIIPLLLAGFSFFRIRSHYVLFFIGLSLVSLVLALDTPLQVLLSMAGIPVLSSSNPTRIIVLWSFAMSILAGFGYDYLGEVISKKIFRHILYVVVTVIAIVMLAWLSVSVFRLLPADKVHIAERNLIIPTLILTLGIFAIFLQFFNKRIRKQSFFLWLIILLIALDSFRFAWKWMPFDSTAILFPDVPVISAMQKLQGTGRVFGGFGTEVQTYYGVRSVEGYDPLYIKRYGEFIKAATTGRYTVPDRSFVGVDRQAKSTEKVLNFLSVSLLFQPKSQLFVNYAYPVWGRPDIYKVVYEDDLFLLYHNKTMLPFARLSYVYEVFTDPKKLLARFYDPDFSYQTTTLLEENPSFPDMIQKDATGSAEIVSMKPTRISIKVNSTSPGLLFLPTPYYPNWHATVNGEATQIYQADYAFQAIKIPKGKSDVIFSYSYF
ncbi:MAG: YfhO family protein [Patescibacteria group bacterium]